MMSSGLRTRRSSSSSPSAARQPSSSPPSNEPMTLMATRGRDGYTGSIAGLSRRTCDCVFWPSRVSTLTRLLTPSKARCAVSTSRSSTAIWSCCERSDRTCFFCSSTRAFNSSTFCALPRLRTELPPDTRRTSAASCCLISLTCASMEMRCGWFLPTTLLNSVSLVSATASCCFRPCTEALCCTSGDSSLPLLRRRAEVSTCSAWALASCAVSAFRRPVSWSSRSSVTTMPLSCWYFDRRVCACSSVARRFLTCSSRKVCDWRVGSMRSSTETSM